MQKFRIYHVPQVPGASFHVEVDSPDEGAKLLSALAGYDKFQSDQNIKPPYPYTDGLEVFDEVSRSWIEWYDDDDEDVDRYADKRVVDPLPQIAGVSRTIFFETERLFVVGVLGSPSRENINRWYFLALTRHPAVPDGGWKIVCTASLSPSCPFKPDLAWVDWIETAGDEEKQGYATELWVAIDAVMNNPIAGDGVTDSGRGFVDKLHRLGLNKEGGKT